jgi:hypothetical protein
MDAFLILRIHNIKFNATSEACARLTLAHVVTATDFGDFYEA